VNSVSELQELVARNRPGAVIDVEYIRNGKSETIQVKLKNNGGTEEMEKREVRYAWDDITVEDVPFKELVKLQLEGGVRVKKLGTGKWKDSGIREGFIISHIDKIPIDNVDDLNQVLEFKKGGILIEGYYADSQKGVYGLEW
jgi:S1-C subfamily serine protease